MDDSTQPERDVRGATATRLNLHAELYDLADTLLKVRALQAFDCGARRLPIHRKARFAARRGLEEIFDDLALRAGLGAHRLDTASLLLDGPGVFVNAKGERKTDYSSGTLEIWAEDVARAESMRAALLDLVGPQRMRAEVFTIDWYFGAGRSLDNVAVDEIADSELLDEAYPSLQPLRTLIDGYLSSPETVLVLQGPPGTGKTRLVRAILAAMSRRKGDSAKVLYTADRRTLESDEIFVQFITGEHDAFVIEDADLLLTPRADGNDHLHRFLCVADGVVRALGRKIIFTTNLPNVSDIDDALVRPGRCFAVLRTRDLHSAEAQRLIDRICVDQPSRAAAATTLLRDDRAHSLASVFRAVASAR